MQPSYNGDRPIAYYSRKLRGAELKYSTTDKEAMAVVSAVKHFDAYLFQREFTIVTDHRPLCYIFSKATSNARVARYAVELSMYQFNIIHKPGKSHYIPDALSRIAAVNARPGKQLETIPPVDPNPFVHFKETELRAEQLKDTGWAEIMNYLEGGTLPKKTNFGMDDFCMINNVLYHVKGTKGGSLKYQFVLPESLVPQALLLVHDSRTAAHPGFMKTYFRSRELFFMRNASAKIRKYIANCAHCQKRKGAVKRQGMLQKFPEIHRPLDRVSVDLTEMSPSRTGNKWILTIVDHVSRYTAFFALPDKRSETVGNAFTHYVTSFGCPLEVVSDRGREFNSDLWRKMCETLTIQTSLTTAYHPESNSCAERVHRTLKDHLAYLVRTQPQEWDEQLGFAQMAINTSYHSSIQTTPYYLFFGRDANLPIGFLGYGCHSYDESYANKVAIRCQRALQDAKEDESLARLRWTRNYNQKVKCSQIRPGDVVLLYDDVGLNAPGVHKKLRYRWRGPYRVIRRTGSVNYEVVGIYEDKRPRIVHINKLKHFKGAQVPFPSVNMNRETNNQVVIEGQDTAGVKPVVEEGRVQRNSAKMGVTCPKESDPTAIHGGNVRCDEWETCLDEMINSFDLEAGDDEFPHVKRPQTRSQTCKLSL